MKFKFLTAVLLATVLIYVEQSSSNNRYKKLTYLEQQELKVINVNYHKYSKLLRDIAFRRAMEIKSKMLPMHLQIDQYYYLLNNAVANNYDLPDEIRNIIMDRQQNYVKLPKNIQRKLIKYNMGLISYNELSDDVKDYLNGRNLLIKDNIRQ